MRPQYSPFLTCTQSGCWRPTCRFLSEMRIGEAGRVTHIYCRHGKRNEGQVRRDNDLTSPPICERGKQATSRAYRTYRGHLQPARDTSEPCFLPRLPTRAPYLAHLIGQLPTRARGSKDETYLEHHLEPGYNSPACLSVRIRTIAGCQRALTWEAQRNSLLLELSIAQTAGCLTDCPRRKFWALCISLGDRHGARGTHRRQ